MHRSSPESKPARRSGRWCSGGVRLFLLFSAACLTGACHAEPGTNVFNDPFVQVTAAIANCPTPRGPSFSAAQAKADAHGRVERGTSCFLSGRCRLPNAYLYDKEIAPRVARFLRQDDRFARSSLWIIVQRRWVVLMGCVDSAEMGIAAERAVKSVDDVEAVVGHWAVDPSAVPYPAAAASSHTSRSP
jgi:hypothetical protein